MARFWTQRRNGRPCAEVLIDMRRSEAPSGEAGPIKVPTSEEAERLFDEAQHLMGLLPRDIGKAQREGRLSAKQLEHLARLDEIEKVLPQESPEWQAIYRRRC